MTASRIRVLAQRQPLDETLFVELMEAESRSLGVTTDVTWVDDLGTCSDVAQVAEARGEFVVLVVAPHTPDLDDLVSGAAGRVVRVDVSLREPDVTPSLLTHIQGRGIEGIRWALRAVHHRARMPVHQLAYGPDREQFGELRLPAGRDDDARHPVVVLLHGGFWRSRWQLDLMDALAVDLAQRGIATWNSEYRRPDRHHWDATVADVRAAVSHVAALAHKFPIDPKRTALVGHSAGGQLAVQVAADLRSAGEQGPTLVVQLAGLVDLVATHERDLGNGAVPRALGGTPEKVPHVFAEASPLSRVPIKVEQAVVVGRSDGPDLREMSRRYVAAAREGGDHVELVEDEGDHFTVIDPSSSIWSRTADLIVRALTS